MKLDIVDQSKTTKKIFFESKNQTLETTVCD